MPQWLAAVVTTALLSIPDSLSSDLPVPMALLLNATGLILPAVVLLRFGLLAAITTIYVVNQLARHIPLARDVGGWTSSPAVLLLLVLGVLAALAFRATTTSRRRV